MHIQVALTEDIINESLSLHYHLQPSGRRLKRRLIWIPLIMLCMSAYLIYTELQQPVLGQNFYMALLYIVFAFVYYFFMRHRMMRSGKKLLHNLGNDSAFDVTVEEDEIITKTSSATISHKLETFTGALMNADLVLLYQANHSFSMFHRKFFERDDFPKFKQLVKTYVHPAVDVSAMASSELPD